MSRTLRRSLLESNLNQRNMNEQLGLKNKFGFALGHVLNDVCACIGITYGLVFFHKVLEFDNLNAGLLVLIGQIADGFSTVFVGVFSDKGDDLWLCNRLGQRKAWHLIGVICILSSFPFLFSLCVVCYGEWSAKYSYSEFSKLIFFSSLQIIFQFGWACSQISHLAAIPDLARSNNNRTLLTSIRYSVSMSSTILVYLTAWAFLSGARQSDMLSPSDASAFQNIVLVCIGVGFVTAIGYQAITKIPSQIELQRQEDYERSPGPLIAPLSPLVPKPLTPRPGSPNLTNKFFNDGLDERNQTSTPRPNETSTPRPKILKTQMCVLDWFKEFQLYQIAMMYMATRLFNNINQCYIPLFLQVTLKLHARFIATVPLAMFISAFVTSFAMDKVNSYFGRKTTSIIGATIGVLGCIWLHFGCTPNDPNVEYHIFTVAILMGIGGTTMLVTSLALTAEFIGSDTSSSAFVYGLMSFVDKLSTGFGVILIQQFTPETDTIEKFYGNVILYACGGASILVILGAISLFYVKVGTRRQSRRKIKVPNRSDFNENEPLLN